MLFLLESCPDLRGLIVCVFYANGTLDKIIFWLSQCPHFRVYRGYKRQLLYCMDTTYDVPNKA